jgi:hypothetical protein
MITKIELTETLEPMYEATDEDLFRWCTHLKSELMNQYPGTEVSVKAVADKSPCKIYVEDTEGNDSYVIRVAVQEFINQYRDKWS